MYKTTVTVNDTIVSEDIGFDILPFPDKARERVRKQGFYCLVIDNDFKTTVYKVEPLYKDKLFHKTCELEYDNSHRVLEND